jgi:hypothetical protein
VFLAVEWSTFARDDSAIILECRYNMPSNSSLKQTVETKYLDIFKNQKP